MAEQATGQRQRLRARFLAAEPRALTDEALLELLLTYAIPRADLQPLAQRLIADFGSLDAVLRAEPSTLATIPGLGGAAITLLQLTARLGTSDAAVPAESSENLPPGAPKAQSSADTLTDETVAPARHDPAGPARFAEAPRCEAEAPPGAKRERTPPKESAAPPTRWRASGRFTAANMLKPGQVTETRLAIQAYVRFRDLAVTRRYLLDEGLPQPSRASRRSIVTTIHERLVAWNPPAWVCRDLIAAADAADPATLRLLLLLHTTRRDALLYAVVQQVIVPRWRDGLTAISHVDIQRFLDLSTADQLEISNWSRKTRTKLAGNLLTVLRDYGLLAGAASKRIVEPVITPRLAAHLARLLEAEGIAADRMADHPDWAIWLLD
ncbi:MAG: BrxA family protein, partial [Chloroflexota bacterium]